MTTASREARPAPSGAAVADSPDSPGAPGAGREASGGSPGTLGAGPGAPGAPALPAGFERAVAAELDSFFAAGRRRAAAAPASAAGFWDRLRSAAAGGKRIRPRLVGLAYRAFNGPEPLRAARLGAAFELLHTALVVHDDVVDRDFLRRGAPTVGAHYRDGALAAGLDAPDATHVGYSAAVIGGDLLLAGAVRLAHRAASGLPQADEVLDGFDGAVADAACGELEDVLLSCLPPGGHPGTERILAMETLKTASYSFAAPLGTGALLAGAGPERAAALAAAGRKLGLAYQIADDVLGTFGDPAATGKPADSDILEGKATLMTAAACHSDPGFAGLLAEARHGLVPPEEVRSRLRGAGADGHALDAASRLVAEALAEARAAAPDTALAAELARLGGTILSREG